LVNLKIPSTSGKLRLKGRGIPGTPPGDFYLTCEVTLPPFNSEADRALYKQMRQEMPYNPAATLRGDT